MSSLSLFGQQSQIVEKQPQSGSQSNLSIRNPKPEGGNDAGQQLGLKEFADNQKYLKRM